ncbi:hypothetical protein GHT07_18945 [Caenimonas koreensis DSM 17982]|uniref:Uncharacterized protein n=1 Tax=Caenimonas koreensis DSM 17982 TaxID=1121255 RepID=A0A844B3K5_9BURK|nr:hypothetical protein [Caenimonas koreensis]MRD49358.1 hypothetical protein [Caenimonas koreensis DSM 17982]
MTVDVSRLAYELRKASEKTLHPLKLGHAQQLVVAALGYGSLAAYQAAVSAGDESSDLAEVAHVVIQADVLEERCSALVPQAEVSSIAALIRQAVSGCLPRAAVHGSENAWFDAMHDMVQRETYNDGQTGSAMAVTNNDGVREIYMPFDVSIADLPGIGDVHEEEIVGHVTMEVDTERPYSGHKVDVRASLFLERLGRSVLAHARFEVESAQLNYDWGGDKEEAQVRAPLFLARTENVQDDRGSLYSLATFVIDDESPLSDPLAEDELFHGIDWHVRADDITIIDVQLPIVPEFVTKAIRRLGHTGFPIVGVHIRQCSLDDDYSLSHPFFEACRVAAGENGQIWHPIKGTFVYRNPMPLG